MISAEQRVKRILILTSHGIRTNAKWQERLEDVVEEAIERRNKAIDAGEPGAAGLQRLHVTFLHNDYKFFSIFSFINPFRRRSQTRRFEERLRSYVQSDEYDEIHLVGHSFGTHIIGHSLLRIGEQLNGKVGTVILAGSVLRGTFPWDTLFKKGIARLVNECGDNDLILVLNAILPLGSGLGGRRGFAGVTGDHFRNRFFRFGHSGYFQKRNPDGPDELWFMRKYWVPLLLGERTTPYIDERSDSAPQLFKGWLVDQTEGLKWLVPLGLFAVLGFVFLYFALVSRTSFNLETLDIAGRVIDDVERRQLDGLQARIDARQAQIEVQANGFAAALEGLVDGDTRRSYFPDQWERARIAAKLAIRPRLLLVDREADQVRFRGSDFATVRTMDTGDDGGPTTVVFDLRTGKPSDSPMWAWSGAHAAAALKTPVEGHSWQGVVSLVAINLQGSIEQKFATALSDDQLSVWEIAREEQRSAWSAARWGGARLVEAHPCGEDGDAIVLSEEGRAWVLRQGGAGPELTSPAPLVHILGNRSCGSFAGITNAQSLIVWAAAGQGRAELAGRRVRSFEFDPKSDDVLLVNSQSGEGEGGERADFLGVGPHSSDGVAVYRKLDAAVAVFSPTGDYLAVENAEPADEAVCAVVAMAELSQESATRRHAQFPCPKSFGQEATALGLSRYVPVFGGSGSFLITRAHRESFGDSHLELRDASGRTDWLTKASRYDVVFLDAMADGTVVVTTSGDSAGEGFGADYGFYVWSQYSNEPVHSDSRDPTLKRKWEARGAWVAPDGSRAIVSWRRSDEASQEEFFETDVVRLEPDAASFIGVERDAVLVPPEWGIDPRMLELDIGARLCGAVPEDATWLPPTLTGEGSAAFATGCLANERFFVRAAIEGQPVQLRFDRVDGSWSLRSRPLAGGDESPLAYANGTTFPDDIQNFVSDEGGRRIFLAHDSGTISRIDFDPTLSVTQISPPPASGKSESMWLSWIADKQRLRVKRFDKEGGWAPTSVEFLTVEGKSIQRFVPPESISLEGDGIFDMNDQYWIVANARVAEYTQAEGDTVVLSHRVLQNLENGKRISYGCNGENYENRSNVGDALPDMRVSETGRFAGAGNLAPTIGEAQRNTEMRVFDLEQEKCLGVFEHGDEIHDFGISADGELLVTRGLNETYVWHIPSHSIVQTVVGPTRLIQDEHGLRIISRADSDYPGAWPIPRNVDAWLAEPSR